MTKHKSQIPQPNCHWKLVECGPHLPAIDFPRCVASSVPHAATATPIRRHRPIKQPPTRSHPPPSIHPLRALSLALLPPPAASSPTRANRRRRRRRCLPSAASQPVLFPRPGQLALPLRAFLATTTWTGLDGRCRLSPRLAPSPRPVFGVAVFWALPRPVALPFRFPNSCLPRRSAPKQSWRRAGFVPDLRPPLPSPASSTNHAAPFLFFSFLSQSQVLFCH